MSSESRLPGWAPPLGIAGALTLALIFVAWAKMETVQITYRIDDLVDQEEELAEEQRRLRTELSTLRAPPNLEKLAPGLGLVPPEPGQLVVVTADPDAFATAVASVPGGDQP